MPTYRALAAIVIAIGACGGRYGGNPTPAKPGSPKAPAGGLDAAALPYQVLDARTGRQVEPPAFWARLAKARAVCVGEEHPNPHHHWVQLEVVRHLAKDVKPAKLALGLEMIQRPFQGVLDDYAAKRIDAAALRSRAGWEDRWGYDWGFYGPTFDVAVAAGGQLLALNTERELTKKVSRKGLAALDATDRAKLPQLDLDNAAHKAWWDDLMSGMGGAAAHSQKPEDNPHAEPKKAKPAMPSAENIYAAQVLWDETMADGGAKWLAANPGGRLVVLAGNGHCHDSAVVGRLKRRGVADAISVRSVLDDGEGEVARILARPMNDFVIVLQLPAGTKAE
jgi:uncharacterized iron-regulated protein